MYFLQHILLDVFVSGDALINGLASVALTHGRGYLGPSFSAIHRAGELKQGVFKANLLILNREGKKI